MGLGFTFSTLAAPEEERQIGRKATGVRFSNKAVRLRESNELTIRVHVSKCSTNVIALHFFFKNTL